MLDEYVIWGVVYIYTNKHVYQSAYRHILMYVGEKERRKKQISETDHIKKINKKICAKFIWWLKCAESK